MPDHYSLSYLSHSTHIKKAVFCFNHFETYYLVEKLIDSSNIKDVYVYTEIPNADILFTRIGKTNVHGISKDEWPTFDLSKKGTCVICLDLNDIDFYHRLGQHKIDEVLIDFNWMGIDTFPIWEALRDSSKKISIAQLKSPLNYKVLKWDKRPSDIEVSVIFPVYNVAKYLNECIDTVTAWKAKYIEFLFVSDGSPDNSEEIILEAAKKDPRIKLFTKPNGGCASARQFGLERASGRYVGFIDPDDFTDPTMLQKLFAKGLEYSADISYCGYNEFYNDTKKSKPVEDLIYEPYFNGTEMREHIDLLIPYMRIGIWRCLFLKELLDKNNISFYTDLKRFDDLPFKVVTLQKARYIVSVPEHLYYYRLDRRGQDIKADDERLFVHFDIFKHLDEEWFNNSNKAQLNYYHVVKLDTHLWALNKLQKKFIKDYTLKAKADLLHLYNKKQLINAVRMCSTRDKVIKLMMILKAK